MAENKRKFYSTGISVLFLGGGDCWEATVAFWDRQFGVPNSIEGTIHNRYRLGLREAIEEVKSMAEQMGVKFDAPTLYLDTERKDQPQHPDGKALVEAEAQRLGWGSDRATPNDGKGEEG